MGLRILVTGGAGFIGSHVAERLLAAGHEVAVLDNLSSGKRNQVPAEAAFFELDLTTDIAPAFERFRPEAIAHLAAQVSVSVSIRNPALDARVNILGSIQLLEAAREHGVRKFLYASSAAVYGPLDTLPLDEEMRCRPISCYGASKYAFEHYLRTAASEWGLEWAALRYANVFGPRQDPDGEAGVVAIFARQVLEGRMPTIFGDGELTRDYVYVDDVAAANVSALQADLQDHPDPVFNVSTGTETTTNRIYELIRSAARSSIEAVYGPDRAGDVRHSVLDSTRFRDLTGWKPRVSLEDGIRRTVDFFKKRASASRARLK